LLSFLSATLDEKGKQPQGRRLLAHCFCFSLFCANSWRTLCSYHNLHFVLDFLWGGGAGKEGGKEGGMIDDWNDILKFLKVP
jgi:hypothetical protein